MTHQEREAFVERQYSKEREQVQNEIQFSEYRSVEDIIDKVNHPEFTRYCVTLLVDELISFETEELSEDDEE